MKGVWRPRLGLIATLFVSLLLVAVAERRLAELHFTVVGTAEFENGEQPEGDQIAKRLIIVDDGAPAPMLCLIEVPGSGAGERRPRLAPTPYAHTPIPALRL